MRNQEFELAAFDLYQSSRQKLINDPTPLIHIEERVTELLVGKVSSAAEEMRKDFDAASQLYPFWKNYPPDDRGRSPKGDQVPWIEVGEHAIGTGLAQLLSEFGARDIGFPNGSDQRFVISSPKLQEWSQGDTDSAWLMVDLKSVGPRDDADHTVMSHNQVSGSGEWDRPDSGVENASMNAVGPKASHPFYPSLPPLVVLPDLTLAYLLTLVLKPVYAMEPYAGEWFGQPLARLDIATIPNGLLLTQRPGYLRSHEGLLFPGKDDKGKNPKKLRARVDFQKLREIANWRHQTLWST